MTGLVTMDREIVELVAQAAAQQAAHQAAAGVMLEARTEIAHQFDTLKQDLLVNMENRFSAYFGRIEPSDHIIQHDRVNRGLEWYDQLVSSIATKVVMGGLCVMAILIGGVWVAAKILGIGA